jgi:hypothetical protein
MLPNPRYACLFVGQSGPGSIPGGCPHLQLPAGGSMSYAVRPGPIGAGLLMPSHWRGPRSLQTGAWEVGRTLRHGESKWRRADLRIPYGQGMEHVAGAAAASLAQSIGFDSAEAKDVEVAVCEACTGLGGRFFVGACETICGCQPPVEPA